MVFDGREYSSAQLIPPIAHHPDAPAVGTSLSGALRIAYLAARRRGQYIGSIHYPFQGLHPSEQPIAFWSASDVDVAQVRFRRLVHVNAVRAIADYRIVATEAATVRLALSVTDGTLTDTETQLDEVDEVGGGIAVFRGGGMTIRQTVAGEAGAVGRSEVTCSLTTVSEDATLTVTLAARAYGPSTSVMGYLPVAVHFWGVTLG